MQTKLEESCRVLGCSGEGVKDPLNWTSELHKLLDDVGFAITAVNDHGKSALLGQGQVTVKPLLLLGKWRAVPVSIQTGFTNCHDPWPSSECDDTRPICRFSLGDMVRLNSHGGKNASMVACYLEDSLTVGGRGADCDDLNQSGGACPLDHGFKILRETMILEVGVSIDECP